MKKYLALLFFSLLIITLTGCGKDSPKTKGKQVQSNEIIISAAASLKDSLTELQKEYMLKNRSVKIIFNFGGSGTLQQQIQQGAPVDIFISAGETQIDTLAKKNLVIQDSITNLLENDLVLVVSKDNKEVNSIEDLSKTSVEKVGIGTPETVPAGKYAQEALINLKLWDTLQPKYVFAKDVTQVLNYVETGNVEAGLIYKSDAQGSTRVKIVSAIPTNLHKKIVYPAVIVSSTKNKEGAENFLSYLLSTSSQKVFEKYGFKPVQK